MKQFLNTLFFLSLSFLLHSQSINITVNGFVVDANGQGVEGVNLYVFTDSLPGFDYYNTVQTDAQGAYSDSFTVPNNFTQGVLYILMTDCNFNDVLASVFWSPADTDLTLDFLYCSGGNPVDTSCYTYLTYDGQTPGGAILGANGLGTPPFTYSWSTGENTQSIAVIQSGLYCVTLTDANGCTSTACEQFFLEPCSATIEYDSVNSGFGLTVIPTGVAPFSYQWSTGETTASILPDVEGLYCATVTDAEGCESEACIYWGNVIDTFCSVIIYPIQGSTMLMADAEGSAPFAFLWNTGETTPQISINGPGDYCVVVTDANGCVSTACYSVATADNYLISGTVYEQDSSGLNGLIGEVYLIQYDPIEGTLTAIDTVALTPIQGGGYYNFGDVPAGDYLIKAALTPDSPGYDSNLPTYYGNVLWWDEAASVTVPYSGIQFFGITLAPGDNPGGPGFIGGFVSDGANFQSGQIDFRDGDPISGVSIILLDELGQAVAYDYTDENGYFEFPSLEWGTYKVAIELLNQERAYYMVTIGPDNPSVNSLRFEVTEDGVVSTLDPALKESLILFPVPVQDVLGVQFESSVSGTALLFVSDYSGRVLLRQPVLLQQGQQRLELGVTRLPAGLYMLGIQSGSQLMGRKFIKQ